ncbi:MAG: DUF5655 domain-containing protein [Candidatus Omnitrophota bacterium]
MPLFEISGQKLTPVEQTNFNIEKELQGLIEKNLGTIFNCQFIVSEFTTGALHAGRIDTLALSEDSNPVIIEYKKIESSDLINQSLFYLSWIQDHRGDFEIAVQKQIGHKIEVDWSDIRVICMAPNYKKYDLHAVQVMGANIELWKYRRFSNSTIYLEEVFKKSCSLSEMGNANKNPVMVAAGKKAFQTRMLGGHSFEKTLEGKPAKIKELALSIQDYIMGLDASMEQSPKKYYIAYKISQNIVCMEIQKKNIRLFLKLSPSDIHTAPDNYKDVSNIGHFGTGDVEFTITSEKDLEIVKPYIEMAYRKVGS